MNEDRSADEKDSADARAFREAVRDVKPLAQTAAPAGLAKRRRRVRAPRSRIEGGILELPIDAPIESANVAPEERLAFRRPGVRDQIVRRLRRGGIPIEDELDLHGLSQANAARLLGEFIGASREAGHRCVRIIHGKGHRSGERGPILKSAVNDWLRRRQEVMAFTSARGIDGGSGALYVLLRA
jgi:DNA-nicking Smr family endonuclease